MAKAGITVQYAGVTVQLIFLRLKEPAMIIGGGYDSLSVPVTENEGTALRVNTKTKLKPTPAATEHLNVLESLPESTLIHNQTII